MFKMGNEASNTLVKTYKYKFPPVDFIYSEEDSLIVKYIATLLYIERYSALYNCVFVWAVYECIPRPHLFASTYGDSDEFFQIGLHNTLTYSLDRKVLETTLYSLIKDRSQHIRIKNECIIDIEIRRPISEIGELEVYVDELWNIVWNKHGGIFDEEYETELIWKLEKGVITLRAIITDKHLFKLGDTRPLTLSNSSYMYSDRTIYEWYREDSKDLIESLSTWVKTVDTKYINENIWNYWELEREEYDSYIQWLPREMMEDTIALL